MRFVILFIAMLLPLQVDAKTLTLIVQAQNTQPYTITKLIGEHMKKHLPDVDSVSVKVVPGANGLNAANYLFNVADRDGYTIGTLTKNIPLRGVLGDKNAQYNIQEFVWLGSVSDARRNPSVLFSNKGFSDDLIIGEVGSTDNSLVDFIKSLTGWNFKKIVGYKDVSDMRLAYLRREIEGLFSNYYGIAHYDITWRKQIILQYGNGMIRHSDLSNVPTLMEHIKTEENRHLLSIFELTNVIISPYVAPPGTPKEKADQLRTAFIKAMNDPQFKEESEKLSIETSWMDWKQIETIINQISKIDQSLLKKID